MHEDCPKCGEKKIRCTTARFCYSCGFDLRNYKNIKSISHFVCKMSNPEMNGDNNKKMNTKSINFSDALSLIKKGYALKRTGWNGKGMYIMGQFPDEHSKMNRPYIFIAGVDSLLVPWIASQTDLFAEDWIIVE